MEPLAPSVAVAGGVLIGTAAALLLLVSGRVAGVSGMVATATRLGARGTPWTQASAFLFGLPIGAAVIALQFRTPQLIVTSSPPLLIAAGILVGYGTRLGNGCTSGHGVCGIARLSPRSLAATATFMAAGAATVFIVRHVLGG